MAAKLNVEIGAKIDGLQKGLLQASGLVAQSTSQMSNATDGVQKSFTILNNTKFTFGANFQTASQKLAQEAAKTSAVLGGSMKQGADQASQALMNFGRIVQDAPFGLMGIANNLNPALESFQRLKAETGSTGNALKALVGQLTGPVGIGVALSLVTTGLLMYEKYQRSASGATEESVKANKQYQDSLDSLANSAAQEIAQLTILYDATQNLNIPLAERKKIVDELQRQYPSYFGNLKDEAILAGEASRAYDSLTQSMINQAITKGGEDLIADKAKELARVAIEFAEQQRKFNEQTGGKGYLAKNRSFNVDENGDVETIVEYKTRLEKEIRDARQSIQNALGGFSAADIIGNFSQSEVKVKPVKTKIDRIDEIDRLKGIGEVFKQTEAVTTLSTDKISENLNQINRDIQDVDITNWQASLEKFNDAASSIAEGGLSDFASGLSEGIAGLASGSLTLQDVGNTLLGIIGDIATRLGKAAIGIGIGMLSIKAAFKNPLTAIAAGAALIAIGALIKNASQITDGGGSSRPEGPAQFGQRIPGFAKGVTNFRGGLAVVGEEGPELVRLPTGSDVISNNRIGQFAGAGTQTIIPEVVIKGQDLVLVFNRAERSRG